MRLALIFSAVGLVAGIGLATYYDAWSLPAVLVIALLTLVPVARHYGAARARELGRRARDR